MLTYVFSLILSVTALHIMTTDWKICCYFYIFTVLYPFTFHNAEHYDWLTHAFFIELIILTDALHAVWTSSNGSNGSNGIYSHALSFWVNKLWYDCVFNSNIPFWLLSKLNEIHCKKRNLQFFRINFLYF